MPSMEGFPCSRSLGRLNEKTRGLSPRFVRVFKAEEKKGTQGRKGARTQRVEGKAEGGAIAQDWRTPTIPSRPPGAAHRVDGRQRCSPVASASVYHTSLHRSRPQGPPFLRAYPILLSTQPETCHANRAHRANLFRPRSHGNPDGLPIDDLPIDPPDAR